MSTANPEETKKMSTAAEVRLKARHNAIRKLYEDQQRVLTTTSDCWVDGTLSLTSVIFYTSVEIKDMNFSCSGTVLQFNGTMWGPGVGYVQSYGGGYFAEDPDWLLGKTINFEMLFGGAGVGAIQMTFWYDGTAVGAFDAIGAGVGIGGGWGDGTFKKV